MSCLSQHDKNEEPFKAPLTSHLTGVSYSLPLDKITFDLIPAEYRDVILYKYIMCINQQIQILHQDFLNHREQTLFEMRVTPSSIVLEKYLNIKYNTDQICIVNKSSIIDDTYLYKKSEIGDTGDSNYWFNEDEASEETDNTYLYNMTESDFDADFKVKVPQSLLETGHSLEEIKATINNYTSVGYEYIIELI